MSSTEEVRDFESLLDHLKTMRGFDFSAYKRTSLQRRVDKRMQMVGVEGYGNYIDHLEVHPEEFISFFNMILINVTSFFRDEPAWDYLAKEVVPRLLKNKRDNEGIRIWSAGCASGQEAYTLAMVMAEAIGPEQVRDRLKIYATDVDEEALGQARQAVYHERDLEEVPQELRAKYFERTSDRYVFDKDLRRSVIFGRHDLVGDAPISRIDLLVCRNCLMYFNAETQTRILARFHFALNDHAYLFLGKAETLLTHTNTFSAVDLRRRIFVKVPRGNLRDRLLLMAQAGNEPVANMVNHSRLREASAESGPVAQIVVDLTGTLALINSSARTLFGLTPNDVGRPFHDLELSYRPAELRSMLDQAYTERRAMSLGHVEWPNAAGEFRCLDVEVVPLFDSTNVILGASIAFTDVTLYSKLRQELQHANQELETTLEELQSTNEELETTNEELQSTVEELETTNEELQSTNEELETMNEELQSTNEELQTMNDELRLRSDEVDELNTFMESILRSLRGGVVVVNRDLQVQVWNSQSENLWGLRSDEVDNRHFFTLDSGLPTDLLIQPLRAILAGDSDHELISTSATNRRGRVFDCRITCVPLQRPGAVADGAADVQGAIMIMEDRDEQKDGTEIETATAKE